jgi:ubiquinone/menaquinone biosynthesis C-methylase UbiE
MNESAWNNHYIRNKSILVYPDENLVRMIKKYTECCENTSDLKCLDCGCGSGRHLILASEIGIGTIIGLDRAYNGLLIAKTSGLPVINGDLSKIPFKDNSFDIIICWGSLHYGYKRDLIEKIIELKRILRPHGVILGTLRSSRDSMMKQGRNLGNDEWITDLSDIANSVVSFYDENELKKHFADFNFQYGLTERTQLGEKKVISHWYFRAEAW